MRSYYRPTLRHAAETARTICLQVTVTVAAALCVTFITKSMTSGEATTASAPAAPQASAPGGLPRLETVVIEDVAEPLSRAATLSAPAVPAPPTSSGLYYAGTDAARDPLRLLAGEAATPPA
jgi:hypothetical protein